MNPATTRPRFRAILNGAACVRPASVMDPLSARLAADLDFQAMMLAGSVASLAVLGVPDLILLTLSEFAGLARRICRAADLPLLCDADHGYGNALNVMRTVEELENAGVAALTIEDTMLPRPFGGDTALLDPAEGLGKVRAAVAARSDPALCVIARTGALSVTGLHDAVARLRAYQDAGVDGMFLTGATKRSEIAAIAKVARVPVLLGGAGPDLEDDSFLAAHGVRIALMGHQPVMAALAAYRATLEAQRAGTTLPEILSAEAMKRLTRDSDYRKWMDAYLK